MSRYGISRWLPPAPTAFPKATFLANLISCIILGYLMGLLSSKSLGKEGQWLLMTGFCGGFSTFSTFTAESYKLMEQGQHSLAFAYMGLSLLTCLVALWLGLKFSGI